MLRLDDLVLATIAVAVAAYVACIAAGWVA